MDVTQLNGHHEIIAKQICIMRIVLRMQESNDVDSDYGDSEIRHDCYNDYAACRYHGRNIWSFPLKYMFTRNVMYTYAQTVVPKVFMRDTLSIFRLEKCDIK